VDIEAYFELDAKRRTALQEVETLQAEANKANRQIAEAKKRGEETRAGIDRMKEIAGKIKVLKERVAVLEVEVENLYLRIPNIPHQSVPAGGEQDGLVVRTWGDPGEPAYPIKPHWEIGEELGILQLERASRMSGSGFTLLVGDAARLERALINFMVEIHLEQGYREVAVPYLVNRAAMTGTGQLPKLSEDMYLCQVDDLFLIPTAEVSVTNIHREENLREDDLPLYYVAQSPCFRREAGAAGKDTRGLLRVHQFNKVEMVKFVFPETSWEELESLTDDAEEVLRRLELPYRVVALASGDLSFAAAKCYDLEVWAAGVGKWLEVSSCSNFTDFQARRARIRFKGPARRGFVHTLNGSGLALPRLLVALMENYQTATGRIKIPAALRPYLQGQEYIG
jgi:seryl-tRNA synthetase